MEEVLNAITIYDNLKKFNSKDEKSFLNAHKILLSNLIEKSGKYRTQGVGIVKGSKFENNYLDISNLNSGIYFMSIKLKGKGRTIKKIIRE